MGNRDGGSVCGAERGQAQDLRPSKGTGCIKVGSGPAKGGGTNRHPRIAFGVTYTQARSHFADHPFWKLPE